MVEAGNRQRKFAIVTVQAGTIQLTQILDEVNRAIVGSTEELSMEVKRQLELRHLSRRETYPQHILTDVLPEVHLARSK